MTIRAFQKLVASWAVLGCLVLVSPASASPTVIFDGSRTTVVLSNELVSALTTLRVTPSGVFPGLLRQGIAAFPIAKGELDLANAKAEVLHSGGLRLSTTDTSVELTQFIIDTTSSAGAVLTGLVKVGGNIVGRIPLFAVTLPTLRLPLPAVRRLVISNVGLTLTSTAAQALNAAFGVTAFSAGIPVGTATLTAIGIRLPNRAR
jgi:hypothetical protein